MPIIFSTVENIQADLMDEYPEAVITPESSNDEKIGKILTRVVAQNHEACDYLYEYNDLIHDLLVGGYMIQEVGWDPTLNYGFGGAYICSAGLRWPMTCILSRCVTSTPAGRTLTAI